MVAANVNKGRDDRASLPFL